MRPKIHEREEMSSSFPCQTIEAKLIANNVERTLSVPFQVFMRGWSGG